MHPFFGWGRMLLWLLVFFVLYLVPREHYAHGEIAEEEFRRRREELERRH